MRPVKYEISHSDMIYIFQADSTSKVFLFKHWSHLPIFHTRDKLFVENHFCFGSFILVMMLRRNDPESRDCLAAAVVCQFATYFSLNLSPTTKSKRHSGSALCLRRRSTRVVLPLTGTRTSFSFQIVFPVNWQ